MMRRDAVRGISQAIQPAACSVLNDELERDPADDDERAVDERRISADQREQPAHDDPHRDNAQHAAGEDDDDFPGHGDGHEDRINRKREVDDLDAHDGRPERRQSQELPRLRRLTPIALLPRRGNARRSGRPGTGRRAI